MVISFLDVNSLAANVRFLVVMTMKCNTCNFFKLENIKHLQIIVLRAIHKGHPHKIAKN